MFSKKSQSSKILNIESIENHNKFKDQNTLPLLSNLKFKLIRAKLSKRSTVRR